MALLYLPEACSSSSPFRVDAGPWAGGVSRGTVGVGTTEVPHSTARTDVREICKEEYSASSGCAGESLTRAEQDVDWGGRRVGGDCDEAQPCRPGIHSSLLVARLGEVTSPGSTQGRFKDLVCVMESAVKLDLHIQQRVHLFHQITTPAIVPAALLHLD